MENFGQVGSSCLCFCLSYVFGFCSSYSCILLLLFMSPVDVLVRHGGRDVFYSPMIRFQSFIKPVPPWL